MTRETQRVTSEMPEGPASAFFGRMDERAVLTERAALAKSGHGQTVILTGEAGIGKSRLARWCAEQMSNCPHYRLTFQCAAHGIDSPAHPFVSGLTTAAGINADEAATSKLETLEAFLALRGPVARAAAPQIAEFLTIPTGTRYPPSDVAPAERRRLMLDALCDVLTASEDGRPVLLVLEDAHWADATSREIVGRLLSSIRTRPVLVLITARPPFILRIAHSGNLTTLPLDRLDHRPVRAIIEAMTPETPLSAEIIDDIVAKSDGIPLFAEELTRSARDAQALRASTHQIGSATETSAIPASLQESLLSRLDRLDAAKDVLQIGAAIGREFARDLVTAASGLPDDEIGTALERLEKEELVSRRGVSHNAIYTFRHALVLDAAYDSLSPDRRCVVHRNIADTILKTFPEIGTREPETLARHLHVAGDAEKAGDWWTKAGEAALWRWAYVEARTQFQRAIDALVIDENEASTMTALKLHILLGQALVSIHGFAAPETVAAFQRANTYAGSIKDNRARFGILYGLWTGAITAGTGATMRNWATSFLDSARKHASLPEVGIGHRMCGTTEFFFGKLAASRAHLEQALVLCDADPDLKIAFQYNVAQRAAAKINLAMTLAPLGERAAGLCLADEAVNDAVAAKHFPTNAFVFGHRFSFDAISGDLVSGRNLVRDMQRFGATFKAPIWQAWVDLFESWLRFHDGEYEGAEKQALGALAFFQGQGVGRFLPMVQSMLASIEARRDPRSSLVMLDGYIAGYEESGEHWFDAEVFRTRAAILLQIGDAPAARDALRKAISIAIEQGARTFRLRAAIDFTALPDADAGEACVALMEALRDLPDDTLEEVARAKDALAALAV